MQWRPAKVAAQVVVAVLAVDAAGAIAAEAEAEVAPGEVVVGAGLGQGQDPGLGRLRVPHGDQVEVAEEGEEAAVVVDTDAKPRKGLLVLDVCYASVPVLQCLALLALPKCFPSQ